MQFRQLRFSPVLCIIIALASPVNALQVTRTPVPGVAFSQDINTDPTSPRILNSASIDLSNPDLEVKAVIARDVIMTTASDKGREIVSSMVGRTDAIAGVNANYFPFTGDPLGLCIVNGELVSEPSMDRVAMGITDDRKAVFGIPKFDARLTPATGQSRQIDGINRPRETNQIVVYTEAYGASTLNKYKATDLVCSCPDLPVQVGKTIKATVLEVKTDSTDVAIPKGGLVISAGGAASTYILSNVKAGDELTLSFNVNSDPMIDWSKVRQAVSGGPWILRDSSTYVDTEAEGFDRAFETTTHPRTAVGATADGKLLMVTLDGRQSIAKGAALKDLASIMRGLGAVNAINLDGGGSTAMSVKGMIINSPCEGTERLVANALVVTTKDKEPELPKLKICGIESGKIAIGENTKLALTWGDDQQMLTDDQLSKVVWGVTGAIGFINQGGYFIPMSARKGKIQALYGTQLVSMDIEVTDGAPAKLEAKCAQDASDPLRFTITITATDAAGNPCAGQEIKLVAACGTLDADTGKTDAKGQFTTAVTWKPNAPSRAITVSASGVKTTLVCPAGEPSAKSAPTTSASPLRLDAKLSPDPINKMRNRIIVTFTDEQGKPAAGRSVKLSVTGGRPDADSGVTNPMGQFTTGIVWKSDAPNRKVMVSAGSHTVTLESKE